MYEIKSDHIISTVCDYFKISSQDMFSDTREAEFAKPRQITQYLHTKYTKLSHHRIGLISCIHGRRVPHDHSSITYAKKTIGFTNDKDIIKDLSVIEGRLSRLKRNVFDGSKDPKVVSMMLSHELINQRVEIERLKNLKKADIKLNDEDVKLLRFLNTLNYQDKKEALHILETKKKVRENMTHKKLRNQLN